MRTCSLCKTERDPGSFYASCPGQCKACILRRRAGIVRTRRCVACGEAKGHVRFRRHRRVCLACDGLPDPEPEPEPPVLRKEHEEIQKAPMGLLRKLVREARKRAALLDRRRFREEGYECDVDLEHCVGLWEAQRGACALTGLPMTGVARAQGTRRLQNASLDRVDSGRNYSRGNTQLVCMAANMMKSGFTTEDFVRFSRCVAEHFSRGGGTA